MRIFLKNVHENNRRGRVIFIQGWKIVVVVLCGVEKVTEVVVPSLEARSLSNPIRSLKLTIEYNDLENPITFY